MAIDTSRKLGHSLGTIPIGLLYKGAEAVGAYGYGSRAMIGVALRKGTEFPGADRSCRSGARVSDLHDALANLPRLAGCGRARRS